MSGLPLALSVAAVSSLLTTVTLATVVRLLGPRILRRQAEDAGEIIALRVRAAVDDGAADAAERVAAAVREAVAAAGTDLLPELRQSVGDGVRDAAGELLPELRREVEHGVRDAVVKAVNPRRVAKAGSSVLDAGLSILFGAGDDVDEDGGGGRR